MTVLELMATMGIDSTAFNDGISAAVKSVEDLSSKTEDLTSPSLGGEKGKTALAPLAEDAKTVDSQLLDLQNTSKETRDVVDGLVSVIDEVVKEGIEAIIEFGAQSIEAAASTGSELANAFNESKSGFETGLDVLKVKVGETLLPIATLFYEVGESIMGITGEEKLAYIAQQLQSYSDLNLEEVKGNLEGVFDLFEKIGDIEPGNIGDYQEGLQSQTEYWNTYADTLGSLKEKGVDPEFLTEIADGSKESMETLAALDAADASGLESLLAAYTEMKAAQEAAAQGISETQLSADETLNSMLDSMVTFASEIDQSETAREGAAATASAIVEGLSEQYPAVEAWVEQIKQKMAELGLGSERKHGGGAGDSFGEGEKVTLNDEDWFATVDVWIEMNEESESNLQSAVSAMELAGEALVSADPKSGSTIQGYLDGLSLSATVTLVPDGGGLPGFATGLDYVPHDDYVARLHEGEAVLTKTEAARWRAGEAGGARASASAQPIQVTVNVTQTDASVEAISDAVLEAIDLARWKA